MFLNLIQLPDHTAETIADELLQCLKNHSFHEDYLQRNLIAFESDGARSNWLPVWQRYFQTSLYGTV
jgi:hypothetical protein